MDALVDCSNAVLLLTTLVVQVEKLVQCVFLCSQMFTHSPRQQLLNCL